MNGMTVTKLFLAIFYCSLVVQPQIQHVGSFSLLSSTPQAHLDELSRILANIQNAMASWFLSKKPASGGLLR
jgi:hypothetical protein